MYKIIRSHTIFTIILISLVSSCSQSQKQEEPLNIPITKYSSEKSTETSSMEDKKKKDIRAFQDAMNAPNYSICEKEANQDTKDQCRDKAIYAKATMSKDVSVCNTIKNTEILGLCIAGSMKISSGTELDNPCINLTIDKAKTSCDGAFTTMQATLKNDQLLCKNIQDESKRHSCILNVVIAEVFKTKNTTLCTKIQDPEGQKNCSSIKFDTNSH